MFQVGRVTKVRGFPQPHLAPTHNHKPQLRPTTHNYHDEVRKNGIPFSLGLMWSIAYHRNCLVNRKTAIVVKMTVNVGIQEKWEVQRMYYPYFLAKGLKPVRLRPCEFYGTHIGAVCSHGTKNNHSSSTQLRTQPCTMSDSTIHPLPPTKAMG